MGDARRADVLLIGQVVTLDPSRPTAEAVAVTGDRILAVGSVEEVRATIGANIEVVDARCGLILPAFHDAHLHLLEYARAVGRLDLGAIDSPEALTISLRREDAALASDVWLVGQRLDEKRFPGEWLPNRADLDRSVGHRPVRLRHRTLHLDIFNTEGLHRLGLLASAASEVEHDAAGQPTGRVYDGAALLRSRLPRPSRAEIGADVRRASNQLLAWGVTTVQDASVTNDLERWELFHDLAASGDLGVRLCMLPGIDWVQLSPWERGCPGRPRSVPNRGGRDGRAPRMGPAKIMLSERDLDLDAIVEQIDSAHRAGFAVGIHAVSEAELVVALLALREAEPNASGSPDRIEHGATIPDEWLPELRATGVTVVGQPGLVYDRGDQYLRDFEPEQHGWLYRARTLEAAGVPYAVGSDAPVTEPSPALMLHALRTRRTRDGAALGANESLDAHQSLRAMTAAPALAAGIVDLGALRAGALADLVVAESGTLDATSPAPRETLLTMLAGEIVWRAGV